MNKRVDEMTKQDKKIVIIRAVVLLFKYIKRKIKERK